MDQMRLLRPSVAFNVIAPWLGHENPDHHAPLRRGESRDEGKAAGATRSAGRQMHWFRARESLRRFLEAL